MKSGSEALGLTGHRRAWRWLWQTGCLLAGVAGSASAQGMVQEFYVPMPEAQLRADYLALASNTGATSDSVLSMTVAIAGTRIVFDHWEDGYEADLNNPTRFATEFWGNDRKAHAKPDGRPYASSWLADGSGAIQSNFVLVPSCAANQIANGDPNSTGVPAPALAASHPTSGPRRAI